MNKNLSWIEIIIVVAIIAIFALWLFPRLIKYLDAYTSTNRTNRPVFVSNFGLM